MTREPVVVIDCEIVEERPALGLHELAHACGLPAERILEFVELGIIEPQAGTARSVAQWRFAAGCIPRLQKAVRLQRDLGIEPQALALVLELLDDIDRLRARLARLQGLPED
jgi:chaperone modulatory protein CbpM